MVFILFCIQGVDVIPWIFLLCMPDIIGLHFNSLEDYPCQKKKK